MAVGGASVVLVHGAWADGSSWGAVIQRLQKAGYRVSAVQLALASMEDDVARTRPTSSGSSTNQPSRPIRGRA